MKILTETSNPQFTLGTLWRRHSFVTTSAPCLLPRELFRNCKVKVPAHTPQTFDQRELESYNVTLLKLFNILILYSLQKSKVTHHLQYCLNT